MFRFDDKKGGLYQGGKNLNGKQKLDQDNKMKQLLLKVPNCPSIPEGPFKFYLKDHEDQLKSQIPELSDEAVRKVLQERFRNLDIETYSIYEEKCSKEQAEYYFKLQQLMKDHPEHSAVIAYELKFHRHPDQPKRPLSATDLHFLEQKDEVLKHHPQLALKDVKEILNERFINLNDEQKAMYKEKVLKSMEEYWLNFEKFWKDHPECNNETFLSDVEQMKRLKLSRALTHLKSSENANKLIDDIIQPATDEKSGLYQDPKKLMGEYCLKLEKFMLDHPECDDSSLRRELRQVIESVSASMGLAGESISENETCAIGTGVKRPATEGESEMNQISKKERSSPEGMESLTEQKVAVEANSVGLKKKKKKKSSVKSVVATIELNVEKKAPKQDVGGLKQKKKKKALTA